MNKIMKVKDMLCNELETYSNLEKIDVQALDKIDKLAHAIKNIDKIIYREEMEQQMNHEYSNYNPMRGNSYGSNSYGGYDDMSYRRNRDNMGRYSRDDYNMNDQFRPRM